MEKSACAKCLKYYEESQDLNEGFYNALESGHTECMQWFINEGADVNNVNKEGNTPLVIAASKGCAEGIKALLEAGGDVNNVNKDWDTPLIISASEGCAEGIKALLEAGADVNKVNKYCNYNDD